MGLEGETHSKGMRPLLFCTCPIASTTVCVCVCVVPEGLKLFRDGFVETHSDCLWFTVQKNLHHTHTHMHKIYCFDSEGATAEYPHPLLCVHDSCVARRLGGGIAGFYLLPCLGLTTLPYHNATRRFNNMCHRKPDSRNLMSKQRIAEKNLASSDIFGLSRQK